MIIHLIANTYGIAGNPSNDSEEINHTGNLYNHDHQPATTNIPPIVSFFTIVEPSGNQLTLEAQVHTKTVVLCVNSA